MTGGRREWRGEERLTGGEAGREGRGEGKRNEVRLTEGEGRGGWEEREEVMEI